jgi:Holliday junction DNA helicase RuvA
MISRISGKVRKKEDMSVVLDLNGISYEILVPRAVMKALDKGIAEDGHIELVTYHYYQVDPSRSIPVLVGFLNEIEREFFEQFISVSGVGPKAACKALSLPFSRIADAIDKGDTVLLKTLPGIGEQRAREIIAKLQNKVGKFGLIQDRFVEKIPAAKSDVKEEAIEVLLQLQYKKKEAEAMVDKALMNNPDVTTCEEILNEVYKQKGK